VFIHKTHRPSERKGVAILAFVTALLVIGTMSLWLLHLTATTNSASMGHFYSTGAFYAAEGGVEMSLRELNSSPATDIDSDGTNGTISDNGNASDDPALATGAFYVSQLSASPPTYRATGKTTQSTSPWSGFRRIIDFRAE
jgi:hypothetical protein